MAVYQYEAMNRQNITVSGSITAADEQAAAARLQETGLIVLDLAEVADKQKRSSLGGGKKVTVYDLALFSRQLAAMIGAGIPVAQSITTLARQTENPTLQEALTDIASSIESGMSLTQAFGKYPKCFDSLYVSMISAGETGGILETVLLRISNQLTKQKQLNDNVKSATSYPKMIGIFAVLMFFAMQIFLVPVFQGFIPENAEIPAVTQFSFTLSANLRTYWYFWLAGAVIVVYGVMMYTKTKSFRAMWESWKLTMPIFGPIITKSVLARFARTLSTLLHGGIPIVQALESAGPTSGSDKINEAVATAIERIEQGSNISRPLDESGLFPPMFINMIAIGEEAGTLSELLDKVAEFYEDDVASLTKNLSSLLEPIMLVLIGLIVGGMMISLYLPIFTSVTSFSG